MEDKLITALKHNARNFGRIMNIKWTPFCIFDFSNKNKDLENVDLGNAKEFSEYIEKKLKECGAELGIGKYNEDRTIYDHSNLFAGGERRTIHLGIDLWVKPGAKILAPLNGVIHSFANNKGDGDYGPTIILEHNLDGIKFYTLYGHLSLDSLESLHVGKPFSQGEVIARVGNYPTNGNWPSHLHFEIIRAMKDKKGDYPGVASINSRNEFLDLCPNPNLILQIEGIN